jgi:energy-coupling factor transporter ATP-binding protein EcfA2
MKLTSIKISNFKAIAHAELNLHPTFNVLVGANGSGKSSVLQALHWMLQSARNPIVAPGAPGKASTLSEKDAIYMPSPEYRSAGHGADYGNFSSNPQFDLEVTAVDAEGAEIAASMYLKAARNEGISVHVPANNVFTAAVRDRKREISAYIPGVAGIPLLEEKRSKLVVHRSAAAGDANMVLRNMLDLLRSETINGRNGLELVSELVARVMGDFALKVDFDGDKHSRVLAAFRAGDMGATGDRAFRPLELAGIGYLQVLQIFCYLVYFRPVLLLVDEPDAHLYPIAQERLVEVLAEVAAEYDSQILLTTHSPSIVRALPHASRVIWMKDGAAAPDGDSSARQLMGWGLLDRKVLLLTEDTRTDMLKALVAQWPECERVTAIWPIQGNGKLPTAETLAGLRALVGDKVKLIVHRDRDFLMPVEAEKYAETYKKLGIEVWFTTHSDVEAHWADEAVVAAHFGVSFVDARALLEEATTEADVDGAATKKRREKRKDALFTFNKDSSLPQFGDAEVIAEVTQFGDQHAILGKTLIARLRDIAAARGLAEANHFAKSVPAALGHTMAPELGKLISEAT